MAPLTATPIRKRGSQQICDIINKCTLWLVPACVRWLASRTQSPVRPHLDVVDSTLHGAIANISPRSAQCRGLISYIWFYRGRGAQASQSRERREKSNDESTVVSSSQSFCYASKGIALTPMMLSSKFCQVELGQQISVRHIHTKLRVSRLVS